VKLFCYYGASRNIRKVFKSSSSYAVTLPIEIVGELKIRKGQKVVVKKSGKKIIIEDWK
jgi:antitoxin component of MazEF toxin-antitoxin module